jgi:predicted RNA binding protein YcfA (HicA-like mRNA interferase family)
MPRLTPVHWKTLECVFVKAGFVFVRQRGDHRIYAKSGVLRPVVVPTYDEITQDIITSNLRTAKISRDEYFRLLEECR